MAAAFPFSDLHSFKDYVGFVKIAAPDRFRPREGVGPADQWTLDLAFEGLRLGLKMAAEEKGERAEFRAARCWWRRRTPRTATATRGVGSSSWRSCRSC